MTCIHRLHSECSCEPGRCDNDPYGDFLARKRHVEMLLAIGIAISLCTVVFSIGYLALERSERAYQIEARV